MPAPLLPASDPSPDPSFFFWLSPPHAARSEPARANTPILEANVTTTWRCNRRAYVEPLVSAGISGVPGAKLSQNHRLSLLLQAVGLNQAPATERR